MRHVNLGTLDVARIGLGAMGMSTAYGGPERDDKAPIPTIHRSLDVVMTPWTPPGAAGRAPPRSSSLGTRDWLTASYASPEGMPGSVPS